MKKIILMSTLILLLPVFSFSQNVPVSDILKVASSYFQLQNYGKELGHTTIIPVTDVNDTLFYAIITNDGGFILISNERSAPPILGYTAQGNFNISEMPPGLQYLIDKYKYSISQLKKNHISPTSTISEQWNNLLEKNKTSLKSIEQVTWLVHTNWNQINGFNQFCPTGCKAGCIAVAMAQILHYWTCRIDPNGGLSYDGVSADFENTLYYWSNMDPDHADTNNAKLIYHAGVSCYTIYGSNSSWSIPSWARNGFVNYWGIDENAEVKLHATHLLTWKDMLIDEIENERPILYSGSKTPISGGHSWIIDGYINQVDLFHCNWGWGGDYNDWYSLGDFNPPDPDLGPYNQNESAIFNVEPAHPTGVEIPDLEAHSFTYSSSGYNIQVPEAFGASSYDWSTSYGTISGNTRTAHLYTPKTATVSVRAYNILCNIYSTYNNKVMTINYGPISGDYILCTSSEQYVLSHYPSSASVAWTASPTAYFTNTSGSGSSFSTAWDGGFRFGAGTIKATLTDTWGTADVTKSVWVGRPSNPSEIYFLPEEVCKGSQYYYQISTNQPSYVDSWYWDLQPPGIIIGSNTGPSLTFYYPSSTTENTYSVGVKAINDCGESPSYHIEYFDVVDCGFMGLSLNISPNPASDLVTIEIESDESIELIEDVETQLRIYDFNLMVRDQKLFVGNETTFDVSSLPDGFYFVKILVSENKYKLLHPLKGQQKDWHGDKSYWKKLQIHH